MFPALTFKSKRVAVFGLARSGMSCAKALELGGAEVFAWDDSDPAVGKAESEGIKTTNLHGIDFKTLDALVLSPGVPLTHPELHWTVLKAKAAGLEIIGDTEVFARELSRVGGKLVAITGTNGKSTTTALIGHVLKQAGLDVDVGGNIGLAVFNLREPVKSRICVLELSSFQIDLMPSLKPEVGILTNLTADHLDRHGTMENYAAVKARMFACMRKGDTALIGVDDDYCRAIADQIPASATARRISVVNDLTEGVSAAEGVLRDKQQGKTIAEIDLRSMPALKGRHNWQNACMAYGVASHFAVPVAKIEAAMNSFPGLAHRMQEIGTMGNITFVNDSKATNADAAEKALSSFENIYWIAGGIAKAGGIEPLKPLFSRITKAYLIGTAAPDFSKSLGSATPHVNSETLAQAVTQAVADAKADTQGKPVILLSPACASFDQYKNFEIRGQALVQLVASLPGVKMAPGQNENLNGGPV